MKYKYNNQARLLKSHREAAKVSQANISKTLGFKSSQFISNIERGMCGIPGPLAKTIAKILKINPSNIVQAYIKDVERNYKSEAGIK